MPLVLGVDIGTTSVKFILVNENLKILWSHSINTNAGIKHSSHSEQDTNKIINCVGQCFQELYNAVDKTLLEQISIVSTCGQMHGCVFWRSSHITTDIDLMQSFNLDDLSNLITWQDQRCDEEFLTSLPVSKTCPAPLSSGFGCATILWLKKHNPSFLKNYDCCGTIADYLVARLCSLVKPVISNQNSASWGYFNPFGQNWDLTTLISANFPLEILPIVSCPGTSAGKLCSEYMGLTHDTNVGIALGDMQCSVLSCQPGANEAVLNMSTSAQLSMVVAREMLELTTIEGDYSRPKPVTQVPYFKDFDLLTSASLNGGDVFAKFVNMLKEWTQLFAPSVTEEEIYEQLINKSSSLDFTMHFPFCLATLLGERHDPQLRCSISDIGSSDLNLPVLAHSIVWGILQNIRHMFESEGRSIDQIEHLRACGGCFRKNNLFKELLPKAFPGVKISFMRDADAAYGAALSVFNI